MQVNSGNPDHTIFNLGKYPLDFIRNCVLHPSPGNDGKTKITDIFGRDKEYFGAKATGRKDKNLNVFGFATRRRKYKEYRYFEKTIIP